MPKRSGALSTRGNHEVGASVGQGEYGRAGAVAPGAGGVGRGGRGAPFKTTALVADGWGYGISYRSYPVAVWRTKTIFDPSADTSGHMAPPDTCVNWRMLPSATVISYRLNVSSPMAPAATTAWPSGRQVGVVQRDRPSPTRGRIAPV